jgi:CubicO group peptidase (beta-lactamase class C family)
MTIDTNIHVRDFLNTLIKHNKTAGVQYLVSGNKAVLFEHNAGLAGFETNMPVNKAACFNVCSVTKTFTSLAVMQLIEKGKLKLLDNASVYLDKYPFSKEITIQQLLSHTSGVANPIPLKWAHLQEEDAVFNSDEFINEVLQTHSKLKCAPGDKFSYSNLNYLMLGKVIEKISAMSYREYIQQNIIAKIYFNCQPPGFSVIDYANYASGYQKRFTILNAILGFYLDRKKFMETSPNKKWVKFKNYYVSGTAYGGLIANAYSLVTFISALFRDNSLLLSNEYKKVLFAKQHTNNGKEIEMTLGWFTGKLNNINYFTHAGGGGGYYCEMRIYPEKNLVTSIMFNRTGISDERFLDKIDSFFLGN